MRTIILDATTKSLQAVMSGAAATTNPDFTASWADNNGTVFTEGSTDGALNGSTPVTLVAAPGASTRRVVKSLTIQNRDTAAVTITLQYNNNTTLRQVMKVTLAINDTFSLEGTYDTNGQFKYVSTTGTVNLATSVTGILPVVNGGTGVGTSIGTGSVLLGGATAKTSAFVYIIDGGGSAITTGSKGFLQIPAAYTITGWTLVADQAGSAVIDVRKSTYSGFPTNSSICAADLPTLSAVQKNQNLSAGTWTTAVTAGDILEFIVNSATTVTKLSLTIVATKT